MNRDTSGKGKVRFDDSLSTVLSGNTDTRVGADAMWRQLLDLLGRRRIASDDEILARLRAMRATVPAEVRAASARALAFAAPDAALVAFVAEDDLAVAAPVLRTARLSGSDWVDIIPRLGPTGRAVMRGRRDLPDDAVRSLEGFGATDFALSYDGPPSPPPRSTVPPSEPAPETSGFVSVAEVANAIPLVEEARRHATEAQDDRPAIPLPPSQIADLVARLDAFRRDNDAAEHAVLPSVRLDRFHFGVDEQGVVRWADREARPLLVGASFDREGPQGRVTFEHQGVRMTRRDRIRDATLTIDGSMALAGRWRIAASPLFDRRTGSFAGYRGSARRTTQPSPPGRAAIEALRQMVHELRTPANAVLGFAELIETQLLGAVPDPYRDHARAIRNEAADLLTAIEDLDAMARLEGGALEIRQGVVAVLPLVRRAINDLQPRARAAGVTLRLDPDSGYREAVADDRITERVIDRLLHLLLAVADRGESLTITVKQGRKAVKITADLPLGFSLDHSRGPADHAGSGGHLLLGVRFTLSLVERLLAAMGGALSVKAQRLTVRLPAASDPAVRDERSARWPDRPSSPTMA